MKKKAQMWDLKTIILLLIIMVILFYLTLNIAKVFTKSGSSQACLLSVIATSKTRGSPTDALSLECYTNFIGELKGDKPKIEKTLSELNYDCWLQFGEGKYDVFEGQFTSKAAHCFICSKFRVQEKITNQEYLDYIRKEYLTETGKSYYDFLYNGFLWNVDKDGAKLSQDPILFVQQLDFDKLEQASFLDSRFADVSAIATLDIDNMINYWFTDTAPIPFDSLEKNKDYSVIYFQISDEYWKQLWLIKGLARVASFLVDAAAYAMIEKKFELYGGKIPPARIMVVPYENVANLNCDMLQG
ncbi:MAG: hypothetical protein ABIJ08_00520 [Nanoarchaeota archaeon]